MSNAITLKATNRAEAIAGVLCVAVVAVLVFNTFTGLPFVAPIALWMGIMTFGSGWHVWRNRKVYWVADEWSVRMLDGERTIWSCRWEEFGGFRRRSGSRVSRLFGFQHEVFDRANHTVGPIVLSGTGDALYLRRALTHNAPASFDPSLHKANQRPVNTRLGLAFLASGFLLWIGTCLVFRFAFSLPTGWITVGFVTYLLSLVLLIVGYFQWKLVPLLRSVKASSSRPVTGSGLAEWKELGRIHPRDLDENRTYGYVDGLRRAERLRRSTLVNRAFLMGYTGFLVLMAVPDVILTKDWGSAIGFVILASIWYGGLEVICLLVKSLSTKLELRFRRTGDEIIVTDRGQERKFSWSRDQLPARRLFQPKGVLRFKGVTVDTRYLVEMPSEADIAEILELREKVETGEG